MTRYQREIDLHPFRSKADRERELPLHSYYHQLAIPALVAATQQASVARPAQDTQVR